MNIASAKLGWFIVIALITHSRCTILKGAFDWLRVLSRSCEDWILRSHANEGFLLC